MLSHIDKDGNAKMVDVSKKSNSERIAIASGFIRIKKDTINLIKNSGLKKGDVLTVAKIAGIQAAKNTSSLIPLCHNIQLDAVEIEIIKNVKKNSMKVKAIVKTSSKTGVEMEALTAVSVTCLTIYDMCKYLNKSIKIANIKLISKKGGKSGTFKI